jgi:superfamily II DNA or RNA helicase
MGTTLSPDEVALSELVGVDTLLRGRQYADRGFVVSHSWQKQGVHVFGEVRGSRSTPYTALARVGRHRNGVLRSFQGSCTCPVRLDCKHSVALLLAALSEEATPRQVIPALPTWERALLPLVEPTQVDQPPGIALQLEVTVAVTGASTHSLGAARVAMRPVVRGKTGNWIRSGITWGQIESPVYLASTISPDHLRLLAEILAMDGSGSRYYHYGNYSIPLEGMTSRRVWDVLAEAVEAGLPLVAVGKRGSAVQLQKTPATLSMALSRQGGHLVARPTVEFSGPPSDAQRVYLIGSPAHGVLRLMAGASGEPDMLIAPLTSPVDPGIQTIAEAGGLTVPKSDENHFFDRYYQPLRGRVRLVADDSLELPEPEPPVLCGRVEFFADHKVALDWSWRHVTGTKTRHEPLWPLPSDQSDIVRVRQLVSAVEAVLPVEPAFLDLATGAVRIAPHVTLDSFDTVRFVTETLPALQEIPGVDIEIVGEVTDYRESTADPVVEIAGVENQHRDWFDLNVTVSVDGHDVPFDLLFVSLAAGESQLILPSGTYFSLDRPEFRQLADLIAEARVLQDSPRGTLRLSRYQTSMWDELNELGILSGQAAEWQQAVSALTDDALASIEPPASLNATLRPYQQAGFSWLAFLQEHGLGGILADEMGLGKTVQVLALLCHVREREPAGAPFLVVAPTSVVGNWAAECQRFAPHLRVQTVTETVKRRGWALKDADADLLVTSFALFRLEYDEYAEIPWAGLIIDEAQAIKNHQSRGYAFAKKLPAPFKLVVTGTPMENNLGELWAMTSIAAPGLFPMLKRFEDYYRKPIERGGDHEKLTQLRRRIRPFMLRRTKEEVVTDLPPITEQVLELELAPKHRRAYQTYLQRERQKVLGLIDDLDGNRFEILQSLTLLRQASLDVSLIDPKQQGVPSTKLDALMDLVSEIAQEGHRTLVFSQFTRYLTLARGRLDDAGIDTCYLDGATRHRAKVIEEFRTGTAPVFLISLKAGGVGLNLTEADYCVLLDPWWNPATEAQAVARSHRIGQTKPVMVYRLVAKDTVEEKVMALKATKAALFGSVMSGSGATGAGLTAADIRDLLD